MFFLGVGIQKSAWGWKTSLRTQMFQKNQCAANMAGGLSSWQTCSGGGRASPLLPLPPVCSEWLWLFSAPFQEKSSETSIWGRETSWLPPKSMCPKSILYLNTVQLFNVTRVFIGWGSYYLTNNWAVSKTTSHLWRLSSGRSNVSRFSILRI